ncbi:hypothetical protein SpAn4DRAFT_0890 [Sporomusa ovata]|uniref:Uncharacterized protein n=1 Tax=Sporomusa ovata TaxID=2378 RepID=A0A0U1L422_9FIRM|nr:hypothetical protein SpAn4DRAFT_0890 [Sporomusa ovata]
MIFLSCSLLLLSRLSGHAAPVPGNKKTPLQELVTSGQGKSVPVLP